MHRALDWSLISHAYWIRPAMAQSAANNSRVRDTEGLHHGLTTTAVVVMIAFAISVP